VEAAYLNRADVPVVRNTTEYMWVSFALLVLHHRMSHFVNWHSNYQHHAASFVGCALSLKRKDNLLQAETVA
jgi:hypothetical protein